MPSFREENDGIFFLPRELHPLKFSEGSNRMTENRAEKAKGCL